MRNDRFDNFNSERDIPKNATRLAFVLRLFHCAGILPG